VIIGILIALALVLAMIVASKKPRQWSREEAAAAFANALDLDDPGTHDKFDLFVGRPIADQTLESLRQEILSICQAEGQPTPGRDFGPLAEAWLRETLSNLQQDAPRAPEDWRLSLQAEREKTVRKLVLLSLVVVWLASVLALAVYWRVLPWFVSWTLCFVATALAPNLGSATWAWMKGRDGWAEL
jgi:hypothetical protein